MFAVVAHFDRQTEEVMINLWKGLRERSISNYAEEVLNRRPHLTLADYSAIDNGFIDMFEDYYQTKDKVDVVFSTLSTFINTGALLLTPTPSVDLIDLHAEHHRRFHHLSDPQSMYLPNKWTPHCTISNRLTPEKLTEAFHFCTQQLKAPIQAEIVQISIIKIEYHNNKAASVSVIREVVMK